MVVGLAVEEPPVWLVDVDDVVPWVEAVPELACVEFDELIMVQMRCLPLVVSYVFTLNIYIMVSFESREVFVD